MNRNKYHGGVLLSERNPETADEVSWLARERVKQPDSDSVPSIELASIL